jgi:hypothetical protein
MALIVVSRWYNGTYLPTKSFQLSQNCLLSFREVFSYINYVVSTNYAGPSSKANGQLGQKYAANGVTGGFALYRAIMRYVE